MSKKKTTITNEYKASNKRNINNCHLLFMTMSS